MTTRICLPPETRDARSRIKGTDRAKLFSNRKPKPVSLPVVGMGSGKLKESNDEQ